MSHAAKAREVINRPGLHRTYKLRDLAKICSEISETTPSEEIAALAQITTYLLGITDRHNTHLHPP